MKSLLDKLMSVSHSHPWRVLSVALVVAVIAAALAARIGFRGDFTELLPASTPEVKDLKEIEDRAGGTGYLMVQVLGGTKEDRRAFAKDAAAAIEPHTDVVRYVEWHLDTEFIAKRALLLLDTDKLEGLKNDVVARIAYERKIANPLYVDLDDEGEKPIDFKAIEKKYSPSRNQGDYIESKNGDELYMLVKPTSTPADLDFNRKLIATVTDALTPLRDGKFKQLQFALTGAYVVRVADDDLMQSDIQRSITLSSVLTLVILLLTARRVAVLPVVGIPVSIGISATYAFTWAIVGHLNPVTGSLGAILIGLGIEYGLHLSMRYWEERRRHEPVEAMQETVHGTFGGALSSAVTNAAAFFVLVFADFEAFKQFGKIAAFGVMFTLVVTYAFGPALLFLSERFALRKPPPVQPHHEEPERFRPSTGMLGAVVALIALSVVGSMSVANRVGFETDLLKLTGESKAADLERHITEQMGIFMIPAVAWVDSLEHAREVAKLARDERDTVGDRSNISEIASINDLLPYDIEKRLSIIKELGAALENTPKSAQADTRVQRFIEMTKVQPWTIDELPIEFRRRFEPFDHKGTFVLLFPRYGFTRIERLEAWADELNTIGAKAAAAGLHAPILDANRLAAKVFSLIRKDGPLIMLLAALVVFGVIWIALKKFTHTLMVTGPLFAGMMCLPGAMLLMDLRLNFLNVVVLPNLLAIAVDNSVHLFHRYKEEGHGSMWRIMRHTGVTAAVATCSNAAGYASMLIARHGGIRSIGLLAVIGVVCTFMGTTVLFPALIELKERIKGQSPAIQPPPQPKNET